MKTPIMDSTELAVRLYSWRLKLGLTLEQASARSGVSITSIGRAETGARELMSGALLKVIGAYGLTPGEFFARIPPIVPPTKPRRGRPRKLSPAVAKRAGVAA